MIEVRALQFQVKGLIEDLRAQYSLNAVMRAKLRQEFEAALLAERVGTTFEAWLEDRLDQAAVAWVLGCVFVRFCEDNDLLHPNDAPLEKRPRWLGGPEEHASTESALRNRQRYLMDNPTHNDRHWLRQAFRYLQSLRATGPLFDEHNPVWLYDISGEAAEALSDFFRRGAGYESLHSDSLNTEFLGNLYQNLSAHARATYALLQTPRHVRGFILDRTFEPAVKYFGLAETSVIDPACGSGHFLLDAYERLFKKWADREPNTDIRLLAERALGQVTGVDLNPAAVAIARFRLLIAGLVASKLRILERAPAFRLRVAVGDALLNWGEQSSHQGELVFPGEDREEFPYITEDADLLADYLKAGAYTVVVGNPPYINPPDKKLKERYRGLYDACSGKYVLTVPFAQRLFELAKKGDNEGDGAGWVGQITANSFMKREFGKKLINVYFRGEAELTEVIDASGAFISGHGTPTVILVGLNRWVSPRYSGSIRTLRGVRGEPDQPADSASGQVWMAIETQIDLPGSESEWISATDAPREELATHPWSLAGGGAVSLMSAINFVKSDIVENRAFRVGVFGIPGEDEAFILGSAVADRLDEDSLDLVSVLIVGDFVRDYGLKDSGSVVFPYSAELDLVGLDRIPRTLGRYLWPLRTTLGNRATFSKLTYFEDGRPWWAWHQLPKDVGASSHVITFGEVATHNHFVLDRGGKVFKQTAPVIKLPDGATEDAHLELLGVLNSSTACFWLKQVCHDKGIRGEGGGFTSTEWERFYQFNSSNVARFPLVSSLPLGRSRRLDRLARQLGAVTPEAIAAERVPTREQLAKAKSEWLSLRAQMIAVQEELDWEVYRLYGLIRDELTTDTPPEIALGERAFEIVLALGADAGSATIEWFNRHHSEPRTEVPAHWPPEYRQLVERRLELIASNRHIALLERPENKRRWSTEGWETLQREALKTWLLDRLEAPEFWGGNPTPLSVAQLAERVRHDKDFRSVLDLWFGSDQHDVVAPLRTLVDEEHVPYLAADRYKPAGLRKRAQWERTWDQQRREDNGEVVDVDVPQRYASADYARPSYARHRGKLDVPKERFISYPRAERDGDPTELLGWAGWDQLAQARALAGVYVDRKNQVGWSAEKLLPLLAGLLELEPWLHQWFAEPQSGFAGSPADFFTGLIDTELRALEVDRSTLARLRGVPRLA